MIGKALGIISLGFYLITPTKIREVREAIKQARVNPEIRNLALRIIGGTQERDYRGQVQGIYRWMRQNIRFVRDPLHVDVLYRPLQLLESGAGDCEDHVTLMCSLANAVGIPAKLRVISRDGENYTHIYGIYKTNSVYTPADTTAPISFGSELPSIRLTPKTYEI